METDCPFFPLSRPHETLRHCVLDVSCQVYSNVLVCPHHQTELQHSFEFIVMWYEDGIKRAGDLMQQPDGLMAAQAVCEGEGLSG